MRYTIISSTAITIIGYFLIMEKTSNGNIGCFSGIVIEKIPESSFDSRKNPLSENHDRVLRKG